MTYAAVGAENRVPLFAHAFPRPERSATVVSAPKHDPGRRPFRSTLQKVFVEPARGGVQREGVQFLASEQRF